MCMKDEWMMTKLFFAEMSFSRAKTCSNTVLVQIAHSIYLTIGSQKVAPLAVKKSLNIQIKILI